VVLEVRHLTTGRLHDINFALRRGEILGIAGLVGAGRTELARSLFGADPISSGDLLLEGQSLLPLSPARAIGAGIGFVTEDRKDEGLVLGLSLRQNITLPSLRRFQRLGFMRQEPEAVLARQAVAELRIQTPGIEQAVRYLSGGNQQKVVLAKWLNIEGESRNGKGPAVLLFDEPTRGVDVGAKAEIYELMRALTSRGMAILMISSELPEILGMSDRILVMRDGYIAGELQGSAASEEAVVTLAAGVATATRQRREATPAPVTMSAAPKRGLLSALGAVSQGTLVVYGVLALLLLAGMVLSPSFRNPGNLFTILRQAVPLGLVSIGQTVAMLAGGIDLSVSSVITLASLLSASLIAGRASLVLPVVILCLGVGALFGLVNGWTSSRLRVDPFIVTLGTMSIGRGLALVYARGPVGSVPAGYQALAYQTVGPVPVAVLLLAVIFVAGLLILRRTRFGRHIYAVGGNQEVARLAGVNVHRIRIAAFVISGMLAAATGLFMSSRMGSGDPNVGPGFELDSITAVIVGGTVLGGGRGGLVGTLGGVLLIALLSNLLNQMNVGNWYQQIIKGLILLIAVAAYWKRGRDG
jgi:ribose/xylose/arabinose/galactoside ABC-type transport system permease subunit/ABC-type multidrug transport system ATPase subunit